MTGSHHPETGRPVQRGSSFGLAVDAYERARPRYPQAAIDWLLEDAPAPVLDLGAGTGKLTRQLVAAGHDVVAVEPTDAMRARLAEEVPEARVLEGRAEAIPLPDAAVGTVVAAQAWHWFDPQRAPAEIARVLRPCGVLGILWNLRDDDEPWVAQLSEILEGGADSTWRLADAPPPEPGPLFGPMLHARFAHADLTDPGRLEDLVRSRSYFIVASRPQQEAILARVRRLAAEHPALAGRASFELPYVTLAYRAGRRS